MLFLQYITRAIIFKCFLAIDQDANFLFLEKQGPLRGSFHFIETKKP
jgi:hypothetical protein